MEKRNLEHYGLNILLFYNLIFINTFNGLLFRYIKYEKFLFLEFHSKLLIIERNIHNIRNKRIRQVNKMVSMTLSIPKDMKKEMELYTEINWSAVAREAIRRKLLVLREMDKLLKNSELTEEDAIFFGKKISRKVTKRLRNV